MEQVSKGEITLLVHECLGLLHKAKKLPRVDFIVADEAQACLTKVLTRQYIDQEMVHTHCKPENMVVLFTADLLKQDPTLSELMEKEPMLEMLTIENLDNPSEKVHYTTALRVKGLEWDTVFLVCSSLTDPKNLFQLFIGASRAKGKVYVCFKD